ncbi:UDP-glucose dehydrogenase family protein [Metabacillus iocasae]|uniref:UDP-glucose 6-dehydrogenase n=1 Tax=Priestia iocasae TaxID=2291674 RepID=A0ABS2QZK2_9BACI|nr:UDP-glucose/GDP-mannose dehydrogenase family protein [Metabacillus iocasae]MBM7704382.1 UDPglucose 6-dehydrogenase [Metabacillus iocasae]
MNICIIGTGYVGLTTSIILAELGHHVISVDKIEEKIHNLSNGIIPIYEPGLEELMQKNRTNLTFTTAIKEAIEKSEVIMIAVGTPSLPDGSTDLQYIDSVVEEIAKHLQTYKTIITKSTVPPGTNERIVTSFLQCGVKRELFRVVSNPEFLREGSAVYDTLHPDRTVIGLEKGDEYSLSILKAMYQQINAPYVITSLTGAEMIKYGSNAFLATKISFINEMAMICDAYQVEVEDVAKGIGADKRVGPHFLQAGIGYGGSCFPKDLKSLQYEANRLGIQTHLLDAVQTINAHLIDVYLKKLKSYVSTLSSKKVAVLGIAFKPNTDDTRHSQAIEFMNALVKEGCEVHTFDPKATLPPYLKGVTQYSNIEKTIENCDCVVIATEWDEFLHFDWKKGHSLLKHHVLLDTRNCLDASKMKELGYIYLGVGRK